MRLSPNDLIIMFLALAVLIGTARILGELARRFNQPAILGELLAGILLGPTVLGRFAPEFVSTLFPRQGNVPLVMDGLTTLALVLFLLVAGLEVDLSTIWRQGKTALTVSIMGIVVPFAIGLAGAWLAPTFLGREPQANPLVFALFLATALAISALPVIAKTLMDLNLYRSDLGMIVIAAAVFDDLTGWLIFAVILSMMPTIEHANGVAQTIWMTLGFAALMLTVVRSLINRILPWIQAHTSWPGGVLGLSLALALFAAATTEWIGVHAVFGAFLAGVAIGDSPHMREHTRSIINQFVSFIFAPLFFASVGLRLNFLLHFDLGLVLIVIVIACLGKILGCGLGARWSGMPPKEAWAVGFGMNARGAMEIVLGLLALQHGVIGEKMFVALVVMALFTSVISGPMITRLLGLKKPRRLTDHLRPKAFVNPLQAADRKEAIQVLSQAAAGASGLDAAAVEQATWNREQLMSTGLGNGIAVPHARLDGLNAPVISIGLSKAGIDFDAPDGEPAQIIFLILTPKNDNGAQIEILADVAKTFGREEMRQKVLRVGSYTEFLALLRTE